MNKLLDENPTDLSDDEIERWLQSVPMCRYEPADMQRMAPLAITAIGLPRGPLPPNP